MLRSSLHVYVFKSCTCRNCVFLGNRFIHPRIAAFPCRRGPVRQLRSDQGTNFIRARRELKEALEEMNHDRIRSELLKQKCDWIIFKMNTPGASHMGGVWERQIRSVRAVLSSLLSRNPTRLDDESLRTFMCEAESIINSRPLVQLTNLQTRIRQNHSRRIIC